MLRRGGRNQERGGGVSFSVFLYSGVILFWNINKKEEEEEEGGGGVIDQLDVDRATRQRKWVPRAPDTKLKWASRNEQRANNRLMDQLVHNNPLRE